jgi:hypothetical protein
VHSPNEDKCDTTDSFHEELVGISDKFPKYHIKTLIGDLSAKEERDKVSKLIIRNELN